jgi:hypothetical protein
MFSGAASDSTTDDGLQHWLPEREDNPPGSNSEIGYGADVEAAARPVDCVGYS